CESLFTGRRKQLLVNADGKRPRVGPIENSGIRRNQGRKTFFRLGTVAAEALCSSLALLLLCQARGGLLFGEGRCLYGCWRSGAGSGLRSFGDGSLCRLGCGSCDDGLVLGLCFLPVMALWLVPCPLFGIRLLGLFPGGQHVLQDSKGSVH